MKEKHPLGVGMIQQWLRRTEPLPFLKSIKETGADFIEMYLSLEQWEKRQMWIEMATAEGLEFTFHGPYQGEYDINHFRNDADNPTKKLYMETLEKASLIISKNNFKSRLNIHGAVSKTETKESLFWRTIEFLTWLIEESRKQEWPFDIVVELLPQDVSKIKTGDRTSDLLRVYKETGNKISGFCWDFGHYRTNEFQNPSDVLDTDFVKLVRHSHVHDIKDIKEGFDHCPLKFDEVPFEEYMKLLQKNDMLTVLELNFNHTSACTDNGSSPENELLKSIARLRKTLLETS